MTDDTLRQAIIDEEHLKLLSLGYVISGGASAFFALFGLFYAAMGAFIGLSFSHIPPSTTQGGQAPPPFIGWIFVGFGLVFFVLLGTFALLKFRVALCLKRRTSRVFCLVIAGISCLEVPYGTVLGTFSFIVLGRPAVMRMFLPSATHGAQTSPGPQNS